MKIAIGAAAVGWLVLAPIAHADKQTYHDYLQSHGVPPAPTSQWKHFDAAGQFICSELRDGTPPALIVSQYNGGFASQYINRYDGGFIAPYAQVVVDGAQHELCPDTIRG
ncbi:DUF732 domain-containing protein [Mycobacterium sp. E1747]|uniref:DUF732 domain-containing protein n=1 Tax=Mycobacterium sp. E1747 TaxID=1834128 RepID=UPI00080110E8|nr:DUF732 domain-containing protein [Mycobacterium sp. E1747]OBH13386.1 hypothetical protein A5695_14095 [Mycobacterium sp. E1747]